MSAAAYRVAMAPPERREQVRLHTFCRARVSAVCWHTKNEGRMTDLQRIRAVEEGMWSGVADEVGVVEYGEHAGCLFAIELKRVGATESDVSDEQRRFGRLLRERGHLWTWAPGADEAILWCHARGIVRPTGWRAPWAVCALEHAL